MHHFHRQRRLLPFQTCRRRRRRPVVVVVVDWHQGSFERSLQIRVTTTTTIIIIIIIIIITTITTTAWLVHYDAPMNGRGQVAIGQRHMLVTTMAQTVVVSLYGSGRCTRTDSGKKVVATQY